MPSFDSLARSASIISPKANTHRRFEDYHAYVGEKLGRYEVLKRLASGGMADVMLARADGIEGFERHVVVKRIKAEHAKEPRFIAMFLDEAKLAATLHHQNIVQVFDIGEADGEYFIAMEYLHGDDVRRMLSVIAKKKAHVPLQHTLAITSAAAAGLHYAHERKIVHRDVSPSNVLVGYDGAVKLVDFGIAKAMRQRDGKGGSFGGKLAYMSPEQCKGEAVDRRSDVWSLGVVLYELATTTRLFKGETDTAIIDQIVQGKIPLPRIRRADLTNELSSIILTALAPDPRRRYQTADELRAALDGYASRNGQTSSPAELGDYVKRLFGARPEPWLPGGLDESRPIAYRSSWTEMSRTSPPAAQGESEPRRLPLVKIALVAAPLLAAALAAAWYFT
jgi:serine/threonine-protein kinase